MCQPPPSLELRTLQWRKHDKVSSMVPLHMLMPLLIFSAPAHHLSTGATYAISCILLYAMLLNVVFLFFSQSTCCWTTF